MVLFTLKIIFHVADFLLFVAGVLVALNLAVKILRPILIPFLFAAFIVISAITYPLTILLRRSGFKVRSFYAFGNRFWSKNKTNTNQAGSAETNEKVNTEKVYEERKQEQTHHRTEAPPVEKKTKIDPWELLELQPGATKEMINKAYRRKIMKNHPDKVATLDPELQKYANQRTLLIRKAYEQLIESV